MKELSHSAPRARPRRAPSVQELIEQGARRLERARVFFGHGTDNARDESAALVLHALSLPHGAPARVYRRRVGPADRERVRALIGRRIKERVPAVYLTGRTWFAGLAFRVDPRVLIPRSPIAELIERRFTPWVAPARVRRVLDLGTGSGCIAIACAKAFRSARIDATDISADALAVARANAAQLKLTGIDFRLGSWFAPLAGARFDLIVSNPPYVAADDPALADPALAHEPRLALTPGTDALRCLREIARDAPQHLAARGWLLLEHGADQGAAVRHELVLAGCRYVRSHRDLAGHERITEGQYDPL